MYTKCNLFNTTEHFTAQEFIFVIDELNVSSPTIERFYSWNIQTRDRSLVY